MFNTGIDLHKLRFVVNQVQDFLPGEIIATIKANEDLAYEL